MKANKQLLVNIFSWCLLLLAWPAHAQSNWLRPQADRLDIDLHALAKAQASRKGLELGPEGSIWLAPTASGEYLWLADSLQKVQIVWPDYAFIVAEVQHENPYTTVLYFDFFKKNLNGPEASQPWMQPRVGILPHLPTQVVIPLRYLNGQEIYMTDRPRVVKAMAFGKPMRPDEVLKVGLRLSPVQLPHFQPRMRINKLYLSRTEPAPMPLLAAPVVDAFGQWTARHWPDKVKNEADLKKRIHHLADSVRKIDFPQEWSRYGGLKAINFGASGFFRTHHDGQRWWLVDPEGCAFISAGLDAVRHANPFMLQGDEDLFAELPPKTDSLMATCYVERADIAGHKFQMVDFTRANLIRVFGQHWQQEWQLLAAGLLKTWRFNTVANWSDGQLARNAGLPWVLPLGNFPDTETKLFRDFPDVFAPEYAEKSDSFAQQMAKYRNDRTLIGYFMRNEPHWAFGNFNLALEMLATTQASHTRDTLAAWLQNRYKGKLAKFNAAWKLKIKGFDDLRRQAIDPDKATDKMKADLWAFSALMVDRYVALPAQALRKVDDKHLNLGMRYSFIENELCYQAGAYFDVFSINGYNRPGPPPTDEITRRTGRPVMIGEFHFGAVDRGLPTNGIQGVLTQAQRAQAYRYYVEQGFARPELIGIHYFLFLDQPVNGRWDGENHNIGFVDVTMQPYRELSQAAAQSHERMYQIATGKAKPFDQAPPDVAKNSE